MTLTGLVRDSASAQPVAGVTILTDGSAFPHTTDSEGSFTVSGLQRGPHALVFLKNGYSPRSYRVHLTQDQGNEMDVGVVLLSRGRLPNPRIFGTVSDSMTGLPISMAQVLVNGETVASTNSSGGFSVQPTNLAWGSNLLLVRRMGYGPLDSELWIASDETEFNLDIELMPFALQMPEVVVEGDRTVYVFGGQRDFLRRARSGLGHYIMREQIERRQPLVITDMIARVPGVSVGPIATGSPIRILRGGGCAPALFIDGIPIDPVGLFPIEININDLVNPEDVEGIEVYKGGATIPPEFLMFGGCGVVAIWTKRY